MNPPGSFLPPSGFLVECRQYETSPLFVAYASYAEILELFDRWFGEDGVKLMLWEHECQETREEESEASCKYCELYNYHRETWENQMMLSLQVRVGTGVFHLDELDTWEQDGWLLADVYQAAYEKVYGERRIIKDEEAPCEDVLYPLTSDLT